jgi:hypothetical protein
VHKNVRCSMVKTVFESHVSLRNCREKIGEIRVDARMQAYVSMCQPASATVRCNVQNVERFLHGNELVLIYITTRFYTLSP